MVHDEGKPVAEMTVAELTDLIDQEARVLARFADVRDELERRYKIEPFPGFEMRSSRKTWKWKEDESIVRETLNKSMRIPLASLTDGKLRSPSSFLSDPAIGEKQKKRIQQELAELTPAAPKLTRVQDREPDREPEDSFAGIPGLASEDPFAGIPGMEPINNTPPGDLPPDLLALMGI